MPQNKRSIAAAITLFFVAPFVAEFLLGNLPAKLLFALIVLAPMYGGGAILIRELTCRAHRGWPTMLLLGVAYALIEEGFIDQSLTNPDYLGIHGHFLDPAFVPALGIGLWWLIFMFNLHVFFSIATSIALVESLFPSRRTTPWLGNIGLTIFTVLFLLGGFAIARQTYMKDHYLTSTPQIIGISIAAIALILIAFRLPAQLTPSEKTSVPSPWTTALVALVCGFLMLIIPMHWGWGAFAAFVSLDAAFLVILATLSRRPAWQPIHTLSIAAGGALAYGLHAFIENPVIPVSNAAARIGNAIFLAIALAIIVLAARRTARASSIASQAS
jgi:hypothetical protein